MNRWKWDAKTKAIIVLAGPKSSKPICQNSKDKDLGR